MLSPHESFSVSSLAALREVNTLKSNMSKTHAEVVLGSFVAKGWLLKSKYAPDSVCTHALRLFTAPLDAVAIRSRPARYSNLCLT